MNIRPLTRKESATFKVLNDAGLRSVVLFVTETGLHKSILDATAPMRALFSGQGYHDFAFQEKGQEFKILKPAKIIGETCVVETQVSLYRPKTKDGDPRYWIYDMKRAGNDGDAFAIFFIQGVLHALNLTQTSVEVGALHSPVMRLLQPLLDSANCISDELLVRLREIASNGPLRAVCSGTTAIGRSLETALGIQINSRPQPDYNGIELKSGRDSPTRSTLFACVPDWNLSACKNSLEILTKFGYSRGEEFKLYCTVSTRKINSQGLQLRLDEAIRWLKEVKVAAPDEQVAIWQLDRLEAKLAEKHRETFWIKARSEMRQNSEWFHLESVIHTKNPNIPQFERLLGDGTITLDHLIKRVRSGKAREKGPLFKITKAGIGQLFHGEPRRHSLVA